MYEALFQNMRVGQKVLPPPYVVRSVSCEVCTPPECQTNSALVVKQVRLPTPQAKWLTTGWSKVRTKCMYKGLF